MSRARPMRYDVDINLHNKGKTETKSNNHNNHNTDDEDEVGPSGFSGSGYGDVTRFTPQVPTVTKATPRRITEKSSDDGHSNFHMVAGGAAVAAVVGIIIVIFAVYCFLKTKKKKKSRELERKRSQNVEMVTSNKTTSRIPNGHNNMAYGEQYRPAAAPSGLPPPTTSAPPPPNTTTLTSTSSPATFSTPTKADKSGAQHKMAASGFDTDHYDKLLKKEEAQSNPYSNSIMNHYEEIPLNPKPSAPKFENKDALYNAPAKGHDDGQGSGSKGNNQHDKDGGRSDVPLLRADEYAEIGSAFTRAESNAYLDVTEPPYNSVPETANSDEIQD